MQLHSLQRAPEAASDKSLYPDLDATVAAEVDESLADRDRICPMLAGVGWLHGNCLTLRLSNGDLKVDAPSRLLRRVLQECDGQATFSEIVERAVPQDRLEFASFLEFMMTKGAVVDAINLAEKSAGFGFQSSPIGRSAPEKMTDRLRHRPTAAHPDHVLASISVGSTPLDRLLEQRTSASTFDDECVDVDVFRAWLWTAAGVVASAHPQAGGTQPHRTLASAGGLYLLRFMVVLIRAVGPYAPGVYAVDYPRARGIHLELVSTDVQLLHRCFFKPWQLTFATGAVFVLGDVRTAALRYRNRALSYMLLEAGAALQNLALSAAGMGLGSATIGGYCEEHVAQLCRVEAGMILGSTIFGARASQEQRRAVALSQPIDFVWGNTQSDEYRLPFHVARARIKGKEDVQFNTFGKSSDPRMAYIKAHAETVERQAAREPRNVIVGRIKDFNVALSPPSVVAYAPQQYATPGFPFARFDSDGLYRWVTGADVLSGQSVALPADLVYIRQHMAQRWPVSTRAISEMNSSGCAAGPTVEFALEAALLELVERDAFMRHWLTQRPGRVIAPEFLAGEVRERIADVASVGCEVVIQKLESAAAHAVLVSATHSDRFFTCVAAAARYEINEAAAAALDELQTSVYTRLTGIDYSPRSPESVTTPEDHTMLYAQRRYFRRAQHVLTPTALVEKIDAASAERDLDTLIGALSAKGFKPCYVDITPERNYLEQGRQPLSVVRAFVPSLIPISFGHAREPRAMVAGVHRRSFFPHPFP